MILSYVNFHTHISVSLLIILVVCACLYEPLMRLLGCKRANRGTSSDRKILEEQRRDIMEHVGPMKMTYKLLKDITDGFSNERLLGSGSYGVVYKGIQKDGHKIAVKLLHGMQGVDDKEFLSEFKTLTKLKHENIVQFVGFCNEAEEVPMEHEGNGYCPPEFVNYQIISMKFDIFSLGVIIIKIICGAEGYYLVDGISPAKFIKRVRG
ncbi:hypothetical protein PR202_ga30717 [Eleusine coracana subsp. coracana]|uniref:Protein kinase domain-containing protein n=1 Tax=Eleusine coracana subsp. coracana TaxID=191504 RepID=A0AAV5DQ22_ELECO|nr:hypothetical protein PR202_ga30717 [Eleusine coracana subsp. coracana]